MLWLVVATAVGAPAHSVSVMTDEHDTPAVVEEVAAESAELSGGTVADYVDALAEADPDDFGVAVNSVDGAEHAAGDADVRFPIQSISKVFSLTLAMQAGRTDLWKRVGREPSGDPFNSLVQLEYEEGIPRNPLINAGALVVDDVLLEHYDDPHKAGLELLSDLVGEDIGVDPTIYDTEEYATHRNAAMASLMASFGNIRYPVDEVMSLYNHQCATNMSTRQLARAVRFLANDGVDPASGRRVLPVRACHRVNAIMFTCGTYDAAGEFAFSVGIPCKSGVCGAIVGVVPHRMGVCVYSPALDHTGNSLAGRYALEQLNDQLDLSVF